MVCEYAIVPAIVVHVDALAHNDAAAKKTCADRRLDDRPFEFGVRERDAQIGRYGPIMGGKQTFGHSAVCNSALLLARPLQI